MTRARTMESTAGKVLNFKGAFVWGVERGRWVSFVSAFGERDTVIIFRGFRLFVSVSSSLRITGPAMEAQMHESRTYVPGPEVYVERSPRRRPGTAIEGIFIAIPKRITNSANTKIKEREMNE